jgi:nitroreductase
MIQAYQRKLEDAFMSHPKHAQPDHDIHDLIRRRWSPRAFDATLEVSRADLFRLFEAARWTPSSMNEQPWRFVVATRAGTPDAFEALLRSLHPANQSWAAAAPILLLVTAHAIAARSGAPNTHALYDTGQAMAFLTLQATAMGLAVRQMEGFDAARARDAAHVPGDFDVVVLAAIGYPGDPAGLPTERHRAAELSPRQRRPVTESLFHGVWGNPLVEKVER